MPIIVKADVVNFATELASTSIGDGMWADVLAYVNQVNLSSLDSAIDIRMARIFLAAHVASVTRRSAAGGYEAAGPVTSESVGGVRRSYALVSGAAEGQTGLSESRYGRMFSQILGSTMIGPLVI